MSWWNRPWVVILLATLSIVVLWQVTSSEPTWSPGVVVSEAPRQAKASSTWSAGGYQYEALASFEVKARVLSRKNYRSDRESEISPFDLALGWGVMSDQAVLDRLSISQGNRWYIYRWQGEDPAPQNEMAHSSANMHIIPGSPEAERALKDAKKGRIVHLKGYLVSIKSNDGWTWRSSLSRTDTGHGACELFWVSEAIILDAPLG